jgi:photosystem II stability/assembly factor-like uncharacterized protein
VAAALVFVVVNDHDPGPHGVTYGNALGPAAGGSASPALAGFKATDMTFVSTTAGWALGTLACGPNRCTAVAGTRDGGKSWALLARPRVTVQTWGCGVQDCVSGIRFTDGLHGYLFGTTTLVSDDGGITWTPQPQADPPGTIVDALEPQGSDVLRITHTRPAPVPEYRLSRQQAGEQSWHYVDAAVRTDLPGWSAQLDRHGQDAYLMVYGNPAKNSPGELVVSRDGGTTWHEQPDPCQQAHVAPHSVATAISTAPGGAMVAVCTLAQPGNQIIRSTDAGKTFTLVQGIPTPAAGQVALFDAADLVVTDADGSIYASHDGGTTWSRGPDDALRSAIGGSPYLGVQNAQVAHWIGPDASQVYVTTDAGRTWSRSSF